LTTNYQFHEFKEEICYRYQYERPTKVVYVKLERYHYRLYVWKL